MTRGRKKTPPPESRFIGVGAIVVSVIAVPFLVCYIAGWSWGFLFLLPLVLYMLHKTYGLLLLFAAWSRWHNSQVVGILILSDSPIWRQYIEREWIPRLGDKVIILNWSNRKSWSRSLPVRLFRYFCAPGDNFNFNPALILLRGIKHPYIYRYYYAFHDAKHGRPGVLHGLEGHMFSQLAAGS